MAIRNLTAWNDELFRKISKPVVKFDERLWNLLDDMRETLEKVGGYGCAAVHVGVLRRAIVILEKERVIELINPEITAQEGSQIVFEGSIAPGNSNSAVTPWGYVDRPRIVTVSALDRFGKPMIITGEDFLAATFCHEIDHLDGVKFTDKAERVIADSEKINQILKKIRRIKNYNSKIND